MLGLSLGATRLSMPTTASTARRAQTTGVMVQLVLLLPPIATGAQQYQTFPTIVLQATSRLPTQLLNTLRQGLGKENHPCDSVTLADFRVGFVVDADNATRLLTARTAVRWMAISGARGVTFTDA